MFILLSYIVRVIWIWTCAYVFITTASHGPHQSSPFFTNSYSFAAVCIYIYKYFFISLFPNRSYLLVCRCRSVCERVYYSHFERRKQKKKHKIQTIRWCCWLTTQRAWYARVRCVCTLPQRNTQTHNRSHTVVAKVVSVEALMPHNVQLRCAMRVSWANMTVSVYNFWNHSHTLASKWAGVYCKIVHVY